MLKKKAVYVCIPGELNSNTITHLGRRNTKTVIVIVAISQQLTVILILFTIL